MALYRVKLKSVKHPRIMDAPNERHIRRMYEHVDIEWIKLLKVRDFFNWLIR